MMLPEENVREQTMTNCKPVFVDIELGFGAFGHCFLIVSQVKEGYCCQELIFFVFLIIPPYLKKEMRENKKQVSAVSYTLFFPP